MSAGFSRSGGIRWEDLNLRFTFLLRHPASATESPARAIRGPGASQAAKCHRHFGPVWPSHPDQFGSLSINLGGLFCARNSHEHSLGTCQGHVRRGCVRVPDAWLPVAQYWHGAGEPAGDK
jgi:hypothetical protein